MRAVVVAVLVVMVVVMVVMAVIVALFLFFIKDHFSSAWVTRK